MQIPSQTKEIFKEVFYDKSVELYNSTDVKEADGHLRQGNLTLDRSILCNVNYKNLNKVQELYGIKDEIEMVLTTDEVVPNLQIIRYKGKFCKIIKSIQYDTHSYLIAQKWLSNLSGWISA